jgi:hypothetical protein
MFNKNIEYISKKKITIFKIQDFLSEDLYNKVADEFPVKKNYNLNNNFGKSSIIFEDNNNQKYSKNIKIFLDIINSSEFFDFFTKKFFFQIAFQQNFLKKVKYLRLPKLNKKNSIFDNFFSKLRVGCEFSSIKNLGGIYPHVDGNKKYLSLMIYFPQKKYNDSEYGTTFWDCNIKNHSNKHLNNLDELQNFKKNSKILYKTPFEKNVLYGFIKNNISWHSVEPIKIGENYVRKSININFFYEN